MLEAFTNPRGVAVIGASPSPGKLGYAVLQNVIQYGYKGRIYPINPKAPEILGLPAYPSVKNIPGPVDLAVVLVPAPRSRRDRRVRAKRDQGCSRHHRRFSRSGPRRPAVGTAADRDCAALRYARDRAECAGDH